MATLEERLMAVEQEQVELKRDNAELKQNNAELKQKIELQTIVIRSLVNEDEVCPSLAQILQILRAPTQKSNHEK